jgi:hypothetical protein
VYGSEVWTLRKSDENTLAVWERKMLGIIFGAVTENGVWRMHTNHELMNMGREPDIISEIRKGRLKWLGHMERMSEERAVKKVFKNTPEIKTSVAKPRR